MGVGRWWSTDAKASIYTGLSPYANCANNPIFNTDHLGDEIIPWFKVKNFLGVGWTKYNSNMGWNSVKLEKSFICFHDSFKEMRYVNINYQTY